MMGTGSRDTFVCDVYCFLPEVIMTKIFFSNVLNHNLVRN